MTILKIDSSITGDASVSRQLTARDRRPARGRQSRRAVVDARPRRRAARRTSRSAVRPTPTCSTNSSPPTRSWSARRCTISPSRASSRRGSTASLVAGKTFRYTANGPEGLAGGKRVIVAFSRGGFYEDASAFEHVESYLRGVFGFIGITPEFVTCRRHCGRSRAARSGHRQRAGRGRAARRLTCFNGGLQ